MNFNDPKIWGTRLNQCEAVMIDVNRISFFLNSEYTLLKRSVIGIGKEDTDGLT